MLQEVLPWKNLGVQDPGLQLHTFRLQTQGCSVSNPSSHPAFLPTTPSSPPSPSFPTSCSAPGDSPKTWGSTSSTCTGCCGWGCPDLALHTHLPPCLTRTAPNRPISAASRPRVSTCRESGGEDAAGIPGGILPSQADSGYSFPPSLKVPVGWLCVDPEKPWVKKYLDNQQKSNSIST